VARTLIPYPYFYGYKDAPLDRSYPITLIIVFRIAGSPIRRLLDVTRDFLENSSRMTWQLSFPLKNSTLSLSCVSLSGHTQSMNFHQKPEPSKPFLVFDLHRRRYPHRKMNIPATISSLQISPVDIYIFIY
jgi:hypothetical protein